MRPCFSKKLRKFTHFWVNLCSLLIVFPHFLLVFCAFCAICSSKPLASWAGKVNNDRHCVSYSTAAE